MHFKRVSETLQILVISLFFTSCATTTNSNSLSEDSNAAAELEQSTPTEELNGENLFQLFLAEIATNRREFGAAAALYSQLGSDYNDVDALQRSVALNQTIENYEQTYVAAKKWHDLRPENETALSALALSSLATDRLEEGTLALEEWLAIDPQADTTLLLSAFPKMEAEQREKLYQDLESLQNQYPENSKLYYLRARLIYSDSEDALELTESALEIEPTLEASLYKFQLLQNLNQIAEAKQQIEMLRAKYPNSRQVGVLHARFIYQYEPSDLTSLAKLHTQFSTEPTIARTYARAAFDQNQYDTSNAVYTHLLSVNELSDEAHYFLGRIDIANEKPESAGDHFSQITQPPYLVSALAEWVSLANQDDEVRILAAIERAKKEDSTREATYWRFQTNFYQLTSQPELAWQTLENGLERFPENISLLYDQAMMAAEKDDNDKMEQNLLKVLELDPNNINALNALGYTWADLSKNLNVAHDYINRALSENEDNPAFQDSKGWVLYRLGNLQEALTWLKKAYAQFQNDEIAAHVAEVQWQLNLKEAALDTLNEIKELYPGSNYIDYLNRLFGEPTK